jgi:DNA-binding transcriptional regulator YdaS (Cro superfamily)
MEGRNLYADTLRIAANTVGGSGNLARRLGVPPDELELWMSGRKAAPLEPFLTALEIIEV